MRRILIFLLFVLVTLSTNALEKNTKLGKPTKEELNMTVYSPDPDAKAVILYRKTQVFYAYMSQGFVLKTRHTVRIKVLKPEGTDYADVGIVYYSPERDIHHDIISDVKGAAYNLENGKIVASKLSNDLKNRERIDKNYSLLKFSIPNVKVGTVIEYSYLQTSDYFWQIEPWYAQQDLPVFYTEYEVETPNWFGFHTEQNGPYSLPWTRSDGQFDIVMTGNIIRCPSRILRIHGDTLPSIKQDSYIWNIHDYCSKVTNELGYIQIPGIYQKNFTKTWEDVLIQIMEDESFGGRLKMNNPLKAEQEAAAEQLQPMNVEQKTDYLRDLLMNRLKWNGKYGVSGLSIKEMRAQESFNSATLNFILLSMLHDAGITAYPVALSRRSRGQLPFTHPTLDAFNAMVLMVMKSDGSYFITDASAAQNGYPLLQLPEDLMSERALAIYSKESFKWINLQKGQTITRVVTSVNAEISEEEKLTGHVSTMRTGAEAAHFRMACSHQNDSIGYTQQIASKFNIEINRWSTRNLEGTGPQVIEDFDFTKQLTFADNNIYFNPFLFVDYSSPFKAETRVYPVEYGTTTQEQFILNLRYPENYEVEECPQAYSVKMPDSGIQMTLVAQNNPTVHTITFNLMYKRSVMFYPVDAYESLRAFGAQAEQMVGKVIVFSKKTE